MLRWTKCIFKLFGRSCLAAFLIWLIYWAFYWFWYACMNLMEVAVVAAVVLIMCAVMGLVALILGSVAKFIEWSCTPPLLEPKEEK